MALEIMPLHPTFGGEVSGINLAITLDANAVVTLKEAMDRYAVLVFPAQHLTDENQIDFARLFGPLERSAFTYRPGATHRLKQPEMVDVSNLDASTGAPLRSDARHRMINLGNRLWHTDSSFKSPCGGLSMLYAHAVPPTGGETEFADMRSAYESLPAETRARLDGLVAEHSLMHSREKLGFTDFSPEERAALPAARHPLVRNNPRTGRKALYLASHASHIIGMPVADSRLLLMELIEHATAHEFVYRHQWRVGDLVVWDNRSTMHRGRAFDESYLRDLRRVTTSHIDQDTMAAAK
jgi:alpha-ketoglutarate-dependent 2,4-dichlorophenoxyacetate dioxygenase